MQAIRKIQNKTLWAFQTGEIMICKEKCIREDSIFDIKRKDG